MCSRCWVAMHCACCKLDTFVTQIARCMIVPPLFSVILQLLSICSYTIIIVMQLILMLYQIQYLPLCLHLLKFNTEEMLHCRCLNYLDVMLHCQGLCWWINSSWIRWSYKIWVYWIMRIIDNKREHFEYIKYFINPLWPSLLNRFTKFKFKKGSPKKFLWASRLWVVRRKEAILGYVPKNDGKI